MKNKITLFLVAICLIAVGAVIFNYGTGINNDPMAEEVEADFFTNLGKDWIQQDFEVPITELKLVIAASEDAGLNYVRTTAAHNEANGKLIIGYKPVGKLKVALELFFLCPPYCDDDDGLTVSR